MLRLPNYIKKIYLCLLLLALMMATLVVKVTAQNEGGETPPATNLSRSGLSTNPALVVDLSGIVHAVWEDELDGLVYSRLEGDQWSQPKPLQLPFSPQDNEPISSLEFLVDSQGNIHAFWLGNRSKLYKSRVAAENFGFENAWARPIQIADFVASYDVDIDDDDNFHAAFIRFREQDEFPTGTYYRKSTDGGFNWTASQLIYSSRYYRSTATETHNVNIRAVGSGDTAKVYIVWDNNPINRVYAARSTDGGATWSEPLEVDKPDLNVGGSDPFGIMVLPQGDNILLVWEKGDAETGCSMVYQVSNDAGETWGEKQTVISNFLGCPKENQFIPNADGPVLLMTTIQEQVYIIGWNWSKWSDLQLQEGINSFRDQETNNLVNLECRQATTGGDGHLYIIGCDRGGSRDIWYMSRSIELDAELFPPPPVWSEPLPIASNPMRIDAPVSVADSQGRLHAFWVQEIETESGETESVIYYSRNDIDGWLNPAQIMSSPDKAAENIDISISPEDRLYMVWNGDQSGEVYFSWANANLANSSLEWAEATILPSERAFGSTPDILSDGSGRILVAYAIPLNESRGIYLTQSLDEGGTWSSPILVFNAEASGINMVEEPRLTQSSPGEIHMMWTANQIPGDGKPVTLYYSRSRDGGMTWTPAEAVVDTPPSWFEMIYDRYTTEFRFWRQVDRAVSSVWQDQSSDGGETWSTPINISIFGGKDDPIDIAQDLTGSPQLLQLAWNQVGTQLLKHWNWDGERWSAMDDLEIKLLPEDRFYTLESAITPDNRLGILYTVEHSGSANAGEKYQIFYTERELDTPMEILPTPTPQAPYFTPTPSEAAVLPTEIVSTATPTPIVSQNNQAAPPDSNRTLFFIAVGGVLIAMVIAAALVIGLQRRGNKV